MPNSNSRKESQPHPSWEKQLWSENQEDSFINLIKDQDLYDFGRSFGDQHISTHEQHLTPSRIPPTTSGSNCPFFEEENEFYALGRSFEEKFNGTCDMHPFPSLYIPSPTLGSPSTSFRMTNFSSGTTIAPTGVPHKSPYKSSKYNRTTLELSISPLCLSSSTLDSTAPSVAVTNSSSGIAPPAGIPETSSHNPSEENHTNVELSVPTDSLTPSTHESTAPRLRASSASTETTTAPTGIPRTKSYKCSLCNYASHRRANLKAHELVHVSKEELRSMGKLYFCDFPGCKYATEGFVRKYDYKRHMQKCRPKREPLAPRMNDMPNFFKHLLG